MSRGFAGAGGGSSDLEHWGIVGARQEHTKEVFSCALPSLIPMGKLLSPLSPSQNVSVFKPKIAAAWWGRGYYRHQTEVSKRAWRDHRHLGGTTDSAIQSPGVSVLRPWRALWPWSCDCSSGAQFAPLGDGENDFPLLGETVSRGDVCKAPSTGRAPSLFKTKLHLCGDSSAGSGPRLEAQITGSHQGFKEAASPPHSELPFLPLGKPTPGQSVSLPIAPPGCRVSHVASLCPSPSL